jgi:hypothetical protein
MDRRRVSCARQGNTAQPHRRYVVCVQQGHTAQPHRRCVVCAQQGHTAQRQQQRLRRRAVSAQHIHIPVPGAWMQGIAVAGEATRGLKTEDAELVLRGASRT